MPYGQLSSRRHDGYPVWTRLAAIALVPLIGLVTLIGRNLADSVQQTEQARRIRAITADLRTLIALGDAMLRETGAAEAVSRARDLGLTPELFARLAGRDYPAERAEASAAADGVLTRMAAGDLAEAAVNVRSVLGSARPPGAAVAGGDAGAALSGVDTRTGAEVHAAYAVVNAAVERELSRVVARLGADEGAASAAGRRSIEEALAIIALSGHCVTVVTDTYDALLGPAEARLDAARRAGNEWAILGDHLDEAKEADLSTADRLAGIVDAAEVAAFRRTVEGFGLAPPPTMTLIAAADVLLGGGALTYGVRALASESVEMLDDTARAKADAAVAELVRLAVAGVAAVAVTVLLVSLLARAHARQLRALAGFARRLSDGELDDLVVAPGGAREVRMVGRALDDAAANLRHVERQAVALAAGHLDDAVLDRPAPGRLGESLHASVRRLATAWREREDDRAALAHRATHDVLTGLPNRAIVHEVLGADADVAGPGRPVAVVFVDLDGFKAVNDEHGHLVGDRLLQEVAARLSGVVRHDDVLARLGGDEFVVLATGVRSAAEARELGDRLVAAVAAIGEVDGVRLTIGASAGIALVEDGVAPEQLLGRADAAVYAAKRAGKGLSVLYEPA